MTIKAVACPALALIRTRAALNHVLEHIARFGVEFVVVVGTAKGAASAFEVEVVARLLFVETLVVDGPFLLAGWAHVGV